LIPGGRLSPTIGGKSIIVAPAIQTFRIAVHQIDEPNPKASGTAVRVKRSWALRFPKAPFDCETLFVWEGFGYVVSKVFNDERAAIYRFPLTPQTEPQTLDFVARLKSTRQSPEETFPQRWQAPGVVWQVGRFCLCDQRQHPEGREIKPFHTRLKHEHVEGCCFVPDGCWPQPKPGKYSFSLIRRSIQPNNSTMRQSPDARLIDDPTPSKTWFT